MAGQEQKKRLIWPVLIFSHTTSPRLKYTVNFLAQYFKTTIRITTNSDEFVNTVGIRINYSDQQITETEIWIKPVQLLFQKNISDVHIECFQHQNNYKAFFATEGKTGFDLFAAIFFLLSRYEEYLPHKKDIYGRYAHQNSLACQHGFLHQPLINIWLEDFRKIIEQSFPGIQIPATQFKFIPTYDIDIAWSYRNKGFLRNAGGFAKSIIKKEWTKIKERANVISKKRKDPFDSYDWMDEVHAKFSLKPVYFFHVGQKINSFDKNISITNTEFRDMIKNSAAQYTIGLHPSWHSGNDPSFLIKEKKYLEEITKQSIIHSRQHYIRFTLPETFRRLLAAGITKDYSMGYGTANGFRASIASSFYWYDLEKEETTNLLLHPFCFMDANSFYEQKFSSEQALEELLSYYCEIKKVNGTMITIWHNSFLGTDNLYKGWKEIYYKFLRIISLS